MILSYLKKRKNIVLLEHLYDRLMPRIIKDNRIFNRLLYSILIGSWFDVDFKEKYKKFKKNDWVNLYDSLYINRIRDEDVTLAQKNTIITFIKGNKIIDVGCGTGIFCSEISKRRNDTKVLGIDISPVAVRDASARFVKNKFLEFKVANISKIPFGNRSFDTVICCHVIEHIPNYVQALKELVRISNNRIIIIVPEEEFKKYSPDYHVNYFNNSNKVSSYLPPTARVRESLIVDSDRLLVIDRVN